VLEDHHGLGKRIVISVLRAGGFEITDYGLGISADDLAKRAISDNVRILLISSLMLPAALHAKDVITRIRKARPDTRIIVGGAPFNFDTNLWREVGADAMGRTASDTLMIVRKFAAEAK
jgi:methanogenic corrinoid protein MtbC1